MNYREADVVKAIYLSFLNQDFLYLNTDHFCVNDLK